MLRFDLKILITKQWLVYFSTSRTEHKPSAFIFKKKIPEDNNVLDLYFLFRDDTEFKTVLFEILMFKNVNEPFDFHT